MFCGPVTHVGLPTFQFETLFSWWYRCEFWDLLSLICVASPSKHSEGNSRTSQPKMVASLQVTAKQNEKTARKSKVPFWFTIVTISAEISSGLFSIQVRSEWPIWQMPDLCFSLSKRCLCLEGVYIVTVIILEVTSSRIFWESHLWIKHACSAALTKASALLCLKIQCS